MTITTNNNGLSANCPGGGTGRRRRLEIHRMMVLWGVVEVQKTTGYAGET
jgi:hypothetical protein